MRLTLRTLLAYRDGVLSPSESSDLHQRIRKTEVASNLLRRVENLVKHKQLLAPKLNGEGLGGDANTVAEYLDDALASEQVPEFERICIAESDLVLAELAHCHQLLAEALNSQVVVPSELRSLAIGLTNPQNQAALQRRLKIGLKSTAGANGNIIRLDGAHPEQSIEPAEVNATETTAAERSQVQAPMLASGGGSIKPQGLDLERPQLAHEVPEYLVGQKSGGWRIPLAIGAMVALLAVLAWQALGPLSNVRDMFVASNTPPNKATENGGPKDSVEPKSTDGKLNDKVDAPTLPTVPPPVATAKDNDTPAGDSPTSDSQISPTEVPPISDAVNDEGASPAEPSGKSFSWTPNSEDANSVLFVLKAADGNASGNASGNSVQRITANTPLPTDAEIVIPPTMRPTLNLAGHGTWAVGGPTLMQLSGDEHVTVTTPLCRAIIKGGALGREVTIAAPTGPVKLRFEEATSRAAVEVAYRPVLHGPVTDKLATKPFLIVVAVEGQVSVIPTREATDNKNYRLVVGEGVAFTDGAPIEFELGAIPSWYRAGSDRPIDLLAAADMHKSMNANVDASAQLTSLCSDSRPETAALAIQTAMLLGRWESFAGDCLNNESLRSHWSTTLTLAEQLIASSEQKAEALRAAFETAHPGRGDALFTLFAGAADSSQPKDVLPKLVESLDSVELNERVLAGHQLRRLMGKDLGFQPSIPNRAVLQQWRRTIASGPSFTPLDNPIWEAKKALR
ncbi:MAG: hypothetical protein SFV81_05230 [Pirellulaceae bacterium]|nr:hypothetical protein [Pirellulaceae bacterium]